MLYFLAFTCSGRSTSPESPRKRVILLFSDTRSEDVPFLIVLRLYPSIQGFEGTILVQMSVIALFSVGWYALRGIPSNGQEETLISWASWDWIISFPWIPALYTGILTTGLCLWAEVIFFFSDFSILVRHPLEAGKTPSSPRIFRV